MDMNHPPSEVALADVTWLTALARSLVRDEQHADDLVQDTWMAAHRSPPQNGGITRAWLGTVLRNFHRRSLRSDKRRARREQTASRSEALQSTAELVEQTELRQQLAECLLSLEEPFRTTLMRVAFENRTPAEIAKHEGVSAAAVRARLRKARALYKAKLERDYGGDWSKWHAALLPYASLPLPLVDGSSAATPAVPRIEGAGSPASAGLITKGTIQAVMSASGILTASLTIGTGTLLYFLYGPGEDSPDLRALLETDSTAELRQAQSPGRRTAVTRRNSDVIETASPGQAVPDAPASVPAASSNALATLELRILSRSPDWSVAVIGEEPPFLGDDGPSWFGEADVGWVSTIDGRGVFCGSPTGVFRVPRVRAGIPLNLIIRDAQWFEVARFEAAPLDPGEARVVDLPIDAFLRDFTGRVVSDTGEPVAQASIQIGRFGEPSTHGHRTDEKGRFTFGKVGLDEIMLSVRADGWARFVETHFRVPDRGPVEIVLERGRTVRIEVRDTRGEPLHDVAILGRPPGGDVARFAYRRSDADGICTFEQVPTRDFPLELIVDGRTFRDTLPYGVGDHIVVIPDWQTCRVTVVGQQQPDNDSTIRIGLREFFPDDWSIETEWLDLKSGEVVFPRVFPGTYEVLLERTTAEGERIRSDPVQVQVTEQSPGDVVLSL